MLLNTEGYVSINEGEGENLREKELGNYDIVVMNPPYNGDLHLEFLNMGINVLRPGAGALVCVEPGQWLTQLKDNGKYTKGGSLSKKIKDNIEGHVKSVELNNMNGEFNIRNKTAISIITIDFNKKYDKIKLNRCGEIFDVNSIYDCNLVGDYNIVKSILDKCRAYKDHMNNHCIDLNKNKLAEIYEKPGICFLRYDNFMINSLGASGPGRLDIFNHPKLIIQYPVLTTFSSYFTVVMTNTPIQNTIPIAKSGNICDCMYGTKQELENWKHLIMYNKLPVFINICLTIDENNNSREYLPWLVDKHYTDKEIYNLLGITKEEQDFINEVLKKYDASSDFFKNYFGA